MSHTISLLRRPLDSRRPLIVTPGYISPEMSPEYMIRALPAVLRTYPRAGYVCVGTLPDDRGDESNSAYVRFLGRLTRILGIEESVDIILEQDDGRATETCLALADVCVFPCSDHPGPGPEIFAPALRSGKPIVRTSLGRAARVLNGSRVLTVPPAYHPGLAEAVLLAVGREPVAVRRSAVGAGTAAAAGGKDSKRLVFAWDGPVETGQQMEAAQPLREARSR